MQFLSSFTRTSAGLSMDVLDPSCACRCRFWQRGMPHFEANMPIRLQAGSAQPERVLLPAAIADQAQGQRQPPSCFFLIFSPQGFLCRSLVSGSPYKQDGRIEVTCTASSLEGRRHRAEPRRTCVLMLTLLWQQALPNKTRYRSFARITIGSQLGAAAFAKTSLMA